MKAWVAACATMLSVPTLTAPDALAQGATDSAPGPTPAAQAPLVRLPFPQDDGSLTPYTFELGYSLMTLVYDTLLWRDADGVPRPWLAQAVETSDDGLRLTLRLADGAPRWHDGQPVTAHDVAFTFDFFARRPHPRFTPELRAVERVVAADAGTVVITLRHPSPGFADQPLSDVPILPAHLWQPLPRSRLAPEGLPVGSGPYRLVDHKPGEGYRFEANAEYFRGPPAVKALEVPIIGDADSTLRALERRRVDMIPVSLPEDAAARVEGLGTRMHQGPVYLGTVLMFNLRQPPFDRIEVRQVLARALDLDRITRAVGAAVPADRGYLHPESQWSSRTVLKVTEDVAAVRRALAPLNLPPIEVVVPDNDPVKMEAGRQAALAFQRVGAQATSRGVSRDELSRLVGEDGSPPSFGTAIWTSPPLASYDPDFLRRLFGSAPDDATLNYPGYRNPAFDAVAQRIAVTADAKARRGAVKEALELLAEDLPVVPLFFSTGIFTYRPAIYDGWAFVKGVGILDKQSFVKVPPVKEEGRPAERVSDDDSKGGDEADRVGETTTVAELLRYAAAAVLGVALLLAAGGLFARRRGARR